jgi:hypothetical protein
MQQQTAIDKKSDIMTEVRKNVNFNLVIDSRRFFSNLYSNRTGDPDENISKNWHNVDVTKIQSFSSRRLFKLFGANDSNFSASLLTHIRMLSDRYSFFAYKPNGMVSESGQKYINELSEWLDRHDDYDGFTEPNTIADQINRIGRNLLTSDNAAAALYAVLDKKTYEIQKYQVIDCDRVFFTKPGDIIEGIKYSKRIPYIYNNNRKQYLNYINFFWQPLDADAGEIFGNNPLRPGLRSTFTKLEFLENLRKILKSHAWPKIKVVLDETAVIRTAPPEVQQDPKQLIEFLNDYISAVEAQLTGIAADQNIILYDTVKEISFLETSKRFDPTPISKLIDSELISSFKAPPSTVGRGGERRTGEGLASAELVIFRRSIKALRKVIEIIYSRSFTLALRLKGIKGFVEFKLKEFSLRPEEEAAQFDSIRKETIIDAWVVGAINDKEKDRKIRDILNLDGPAPNDARIREDPRAIKSDRQTERMPIEDEQKETKRTETRRRKKEGSDRKDL